MNDSPFEQWRLAKMQGMAASREIMELLALAFEGGRVAEREACAKLLDDFTKIEMVPVKDTWRMGVMAAANAVRDKK